MDHAWYEIDNYLFSDSELILKSVNDCGRISLLSFSWEIREYINYHNIYSCG